MGTRAIYEWVKMKTQKKGARKHLAWSSDTQLIDVNPRRYLMMLLQRIYSDADLRLLNTRPSEHTIRIADTNVNMTFHYNGRRCIGNNRIPIW